jgi:hypothetical protein
VFPLDTSGEEGEIAISDIVKLIIINVVAQMDYPNRSSNGQPKFSYRGIRVKRNVGGLNP